MQINADPHSVKRARSLSQIERVQNLCGKESKRQQLILSSRRGIESVLLKFSVLVMRSR